MSNQEPEDEPTEAIYLDANQFTALIIGLPEAIAGCKHRLQFFKSEEALGVLMTQHKMSEKKAKDNIAENIALAESLLETYPGIISEVREAYTMLQERVESKKKILLDPEWPPKIH